MRITESTDLGHIIREARQKQGLTQTELAVQAGVGRRFLTELEAGKPTAQIGKIILVMMMLGLEMHVGMKQTLSRQRSLL